MIMVTNCVESSMKATNRKTACATMVTVAMVVMTTHVMTSPIVSEFMRAREEIKAEELQMMIGGQLTLTADEKIVSDILVQEKQKLMDDSRVNRTVYFPASSFFYSKPLMENTTVFKLIKRMPKGSLLHTHGLSVVSLDWLVQNATYRPNVFMCVDKGGFTILRVFDRPPSNPDCPWKRVRDMRSTARTRQQFDQILKANLSLLSTDPIKTFPTNAKAWDRFSKYFAQLANLINYVPIYRDYIWQMLEEVRDDNVQYVELRTSLPLLFELNGTLHDAEYGVQLFRDVVADFVRAHPDFSGAKMILSGIKRMSQSTILSEVQLVMNLHKKYPDVVKGYDLAGDEDYFNTVNYYNEALLYPSRQTPPFSLPFFLHAGETNWQGTSVDLNMLDALLLNTTRMGHGFGLVKHPELVQLMRERDIAVEVNPISNQVLRLVNDLRNHPIISLMASGFPIVVGSDNFATWEALPLSHDFYVAFMVMSGRDVGLTFLKQLIINSIRYSALTQTEKVKAMSLWQSKWDRFIDDIKSEIHWSASD